MVEPLPPTVVTWAAGTSWAFLALTLLLIVKGELARRKRLQTPANPARILRRAREIVHRAAGVPTAGWCCGTSRKTTDAALYPLEALK